MITKIPIRENTFKPRKNNFLYLALFFAIGIFVGDAVHSTELFAGAFSLTLVFGIIGLLFLLFTFKNELTISDSGITSKNLFKAKELNWQQIQAISFQFVWHGKSGHHELMFLTANSKQNIIIVANYYNRSQLKEIAQLIITKYQGNISPKITQMAEGIFPWYLF